MIDTLMAFWNQNRRRRAGQVLLTFFLMCISISLLFVAMSLPQWSHTHPQGSMTGKAGNKGSIGTETTGEIGGIGATPPTVVVQITQGPQTKPTSTVIVPSQATPTPSGSASSCTTPDAQVNVNATTSTNVAPLQVTPYTPKTPATQATSPMVHSPATPTMTQTPLPTTIATVTVDATATVTPSPSASPTTTPATAPIVTGRSGTPPPMRPQQQDGGGPLNDGTPVSASPVPGSTPPGSTQHIGGGWISACNSNNIGIEAGASVVEVVWQHLWLILGASLMCTVLFYGIVWRMRKNQT